MRSVPDSLKERHGKWGVKSLSLNSFEHDELHYILDPKEYMAQTSPAKASASLKKRR